MVGGVQAGPSPRECAPWPPGPHPHSPFSADPGATLHPNKGPDTPSGWCWVKGHPGVEQWRHSVSRCPRRCLEPKLRPGSCKHPPAPLTAAWPGPGDPSCGVWGVGRGTAWRGEGFWDRLQPRGVHPEFAGPRCCPGPCGLWPPRQGLVSGSPWGRLAARAVPASFSLVVRHRCRGWRGWGWPVPRGLGSWTWFQCPAGGGPAMGFVSHRRGPQPFCHQLCNHKQLRSRL